MGQPILEARALSGPAPKPRVHDIDLHVHRGEVRHVFGASGSGKTSLLRVLARLDPASAGHLRLNDTGTSDVPITEWRRRVGLVFQDNRMLPGTVADNLCWGASLHGIDRDPAEALDAVGLELDLDRDAHSLSGGEAKRVAIARALALEPDVLLLDEPTASLDEAHRNTIRSLIRRLADSGRAVVLVSHVRDDLVAVPGPATHLAGGRIVDQRPSRELHERLQEATL